MVGGQPAADAGRRGGLVPADGPGAARHEGVQPSAHLIAEAAHRGETVQRCGTGLLWLHGGNLSLTKFS